MKFDPKHLILAALLGLAILYIVPRVNKAG